jgi:hypothetical protein
MRWKISPNRIDLLFVAAAVGATLLVAFLVLVLFHLRIAS